MTVYSSSILEMIVNIMTAEAELARKSGSCPEHVSEIANLGFFGRSGSLSLDDAPTNRFKADPS
jgi:hypothetical protein